MTFKKQLFLFFTLLCCTGMYVQAQSIKGTVTDATTGEPMFGATVLIKENGMKRLIQLDGNFQFKSLVPGVYHIEVSFTNHKTISKEVSVVKGKSAEIRFNLESSTVELSGITILAGGNGTDRTIRALEKNSNQLVNIVSAKNMELLPDITVANVMQRVSGVNLEKNSAGEARYPIIRGMEKRYINTLVNGIKIPSPDNKSRFIPLDLFPSEILERLEVSKSLTPSMEADAIGGTINLVMKDAPSSKLLQLNLSEGYNNIFSDQPFLKFDRNSISKLSPTELHGSNYIATPGDFSNQSLYYTELKAPKNMTLGLTTGNRFGKDKKLGILISGSYQNIHSGNQSTLFLPNAQPGLDNIPQFIDLYSRQYSTQNQRLGLNGKVDYKFNKNNKISLLNTFVRLDAMQVRHNFDTIALNSLLSEAYRTSWQYQSIYNSTLQGLHQLSSSLQLDWTLGYSTAKNNLPDLGSFSHEYPVLVDATKGTVTKGTPDILGTMSRGWTHNSDKDVTGNINVTKQLSFYGRPMELKFGGLFRTKNRDNFYNSYSMNPLLPTGSSVQTFTTLYNAVFTFKGSNAMPSLNGNNYTFNENIAAGYIQGKFNLTSRIELLGGFRYENTYQEYETELSKDVDAKSGSIHYADLLPSAQLKYKINNAQALRISYYEAIARPQFAELIPDGPDSYETFKEKGNPTGLKHTLANNYDVRYEFFPGNADQILIGTFYKRIQDPIEYNAVKTGVTSQNLIPTNIGTATNYGIEAVFTKYFGVFGVSANYTYTQSKVTNDSMLLSYRNTAGVRTSKYVSETRPLQGQANHIGNISLLFKSTRLGLDAQLAVVYTGERISLVSPYAGLHYWQQPITGIDFSFEKKVVKKLTFYGKLTNLTNSPSIVSLHIPYSTYMTSSGSRPLAMQSDPAHKIIVQKDYLKSSFLFGLRFKL